MIEGLHFPLVGKAHNFLAYKEGDVDSFKELRAIFIEKFQGGDIGDRFPAVSAPGELVVITHKG